MNKYYFGSVIILIIITILIFFLIRSNKSTSPVATTSPTSPSSPVVTGSPSSPVTIKPTLAYPLHYDILNYSNYSNGTGTPISDARMVGGFPTYDSSASLVFTGDNYIVLPSISSGNITAFTCWFKSNNNPNDVPIIDIHPTFKLYINGLKNSLMFNDVYTINTTTNINNNEWVFIAINTTGNTISWVINDGATGNSGSGSLSTPVSFSNSAGYLGHSFGNINKFKGNLMMVIFFPNQNLTSEQITTLHKYGHW
jgi:hypothetical protein